MVSSTVSIIAAMQNSKRRSLIFLIVFTFIGLIFTYQVYELCNYDFVQFGYENEQIVKSKVERVRVSDVIAVQKFISQAHAAVQNHEFYRYNQPLSDKIGAFRALPDTRDDICSTRSYRIPIRNSKVSVIIAYHNEARSMLIRTIMSIFRRTSEKYLHELILVDDFSEDATLLPALQQLDFAPFTYNFIKNVTSSSSSSSSSTTPMVTIKMQRNNQRLGVIESRNRGARLATGDYLLFLDSHCEVNAGWLEPLLERVADSTSSRKYGDGVVTTIAVSPILDSIDAETLEYRASSKNLMGGFDWNLHFHWVQRPIAAEKQGAAFKSPTFAGGIFMVSRNWFFKLNAFNTLLQIWGGESIEFSIKLWLCGGQIEIVPCSRIGHIFRKQHPFDFPNANDGQATYLRNSKIIAESWLDAYKYFFYASKPEAKNIYVNISHDILYKFKQDLHCRPFVWYLQNVFTQLKLPMDDFIAFGTLSSSERCLQILAPYTSDRRRRQLLSATATLSTQLLMGNCYQSDVTHWYLHRHNCQLHSSHGSCLAVVQYSSAKESLSKHFAVVHQLCRKSSATQRWLRRGAQLIHERTHLCLDNMLRENVAVSVCRHAAPSQLFRFSMEMQYL